MSKHNINLSELSQYVHDMRQLMDQIEDLLKRSLLEEANDKTDAE